MKKFLQGVSSFRFEEKFVTLRENSKALIDKHPEIFCLTLLAVFCLIFLFLGLGLYPLIDVDETRYALIARGMVDSGNWNNLMFNSLPFLEKPPLYFWLVSSSISLLGGFSAWAVRLPIAIISALLIFATYFLGSKIISRKFGIISALILLSSMFFLIFSHIAILDMVLTVFMTLSLYCYFLTHFCLVKNKKYSWWAFYAFAGLGFLAKGILAIAIPAVIIFIYGRLTKTLKDVFKPVNLLPGLIVFLALITPWHVLMYKEYGFQFVKEYFLIHHFGRFMGSEYIGRERPFLYFVPVFLLGFLPWSFTFIAFLYNGIKKLREKFNAAQGKFLEKISAVLEADTNEKRLILFASICFAVIFLVFSTASTKLPTYILPAFPPAALLMGYYWWVSDEKGENRKSISISTWILASVFFIAATVTIAFIGLLPLALQYQIDVFKNVTVIGLYFLAIFLILRLNTKRALSVFSGYILVMIFIIFLSVFHIFEFVYNGGQDEIVNYSKISANPDISSQLVTFDFAVKPSVLIGYKTGVTFITDPDFDKLDELLKSSTGPTFVIVKNKNFDTDKEYRAKIEQRMELVQSGQRYSLYVHDVNKIYKNPMGCYMLDNNWKCHGK